MVILIYLYKCIKTKRNNRIFTVATMTTISTASKHGRIVYFAWVCKTRATLILPLSIGLLTPQRRAGRVVQTVDFFVASSMQTHQSAKTGHELGHYHLGRLRRLLWVVDGRRHSPGSHLLRQERTVAPPQLLVYLTSSAGSRIQSSV